jgi:hypothetical protein
LPVPRASTASAPISKARVPNSLIARLLRSPGYRGRPPAGQVSLPRGRHQGRCPRPSLARTLRRARAVNKLDPKLEPTATCTRSTDRRLSLSVTCLADWFDSPCRIFVAGCDLGLVSRRAQICQVWFWGDGLDCPGNAGGMFQLYGQAGAGFHDPPSPCPAPAVPSAAASRAGSRSAENTFCSMCQSCG